MHGRVPSVRKRGCASALAIYCRPAGKHTIEQQPNAFSVRPGRSDQSDNAASGPYPLLLLNLCASFTETRVSDRDTSGAALWNHGTPSAYSAQEGGDEEGERHFEREESSRGLEFLRVSRRNSPFEKRVSTFQQQQQQPAETQVREGQRGRAPASRHSRRSKSGALRLSGFTLLAAEPGRGQRERERVLQCRRDGREQHCTRTNVLCILFVSLSQQQCRRWLFCPRATGPPAPPPAAASVSLSLSAGVDQRVKDSPHRPCISRELPHVEYVSLAACLHNKQSTTLFSSVKKTAHSAREKRSAKSSPTLRTPGAGRA